MATSDRKPKIRTHSTKIGDDTYTVTRIDVMKSFALFPLFAPVIGRLLSRLLGILKELGMVDEGAKALTWGDITGLIDDDAKLMAFLSDHAERLMSDIGDVIGILKPDDVYKLQRELFASMTKNRLPMFPKDDTKRFEEEFGGDPMRVGRLFIFALRVNYADFSLAVAPEAGSSQPAPDAAADPSQASTT